jgi:hypothetical protein
MAIPPFASFTTRFATAVDPTCTASGIGPKGSNWAPVEVASPLARALGMYLSWTEGGSAASAGGEKARDVISVALDTATTANFFMHPPESAGGV